MRKVLVLLIVLVGHALLLGVVYLSGGDKKDDSQAVNNPTEDTRPDSFEETAEQPSDNEELIFDEPSTDQDITHVVKKGEYLSTIANKYGVSLDKLCEHNGITDAGKIRIGQKIAIPTK